MTTYVAEILWEDSPNQWAGKDGSRYATSEEAQASIGALKARNAARDTPRVILDTRLVESPYKATNVWNFEHNCSIARGGGK